MVQIGYALLSLREINLKEAPLYFDTPNVLQSSLVPSSGYSVTFVASMSMEVNFVNCHYDRCNTF